MNLNSVLIGSEDPKRLAEYYTKLFGEPGWDQGGFTGWQIGTGWMTVGPHDQVKGENPQPGRLMWNMESSDVKGDFDRFKAAGATVDPGALPARRGARGVHRHVRGPRRQLLPAHQPDAALTRSSTA